MQQEAPEHRKYELIADSKITVGDIDLFRIRALVSFGGVSAVDILPALKDGDSRIFQ